MNWLIVVTLFEYIGHVILEDPEIELDLACKPRPIVQDIAPVEMATQPRTIKIFHCSGFSGNPYTTKNTKCVPVKKKAIRIDYINNINKTSYKTFYNHTRCEMKCVCTLNGYKCRNGPVRIVCPLGLEWSTDMCKCIVTSNPQVIEKSTKAGSKPKESGITVSFLMMALIGELLVVGIFIYAVRKIKSNHVEKGQALNEEERLWNSPGHFKHKLTPNLTLINLKRILGLFHGYSIAILGLFWGYSRAKFIRV